MSSLSVSSVKSFMLRARVIAPPRRPIKLCERMCLCVTSAAKIHLTHSCSCLGCKDLFDLLVEVFTFKCLRLCLAEANIGSEDSSLSDALVLDDGEFL